jgi:hypothetical protein
MAARIHFERSIATDHAVTMENVRSADQILARLVAAAYAADHPEYFGKEKEELTAGRRGHTLEAGGTTSCCKQLMAPDHAA